MRAPEGRAVRLLGRTLGGLLAVAAVLLLLVHAKASDADRDVSRSCGSGLDVIVGRTGWEEWWTQDLSDPALIQDRALLRTTDCPDAVNRNIVTAGVLAALAVAAIGTVEYLSRQRPDTDGRTGRLPLQTIGTAVAAVGGVLLVSGVAGVVLLVADPDDTLFLFVSRATVTLIGLVLLLPAVMLVVAGYALRLAGKTLEDDESRAR